MRCITFFFTLILCVLFCFVFDTEAVNTPVDEDLDDSSTNRSEMHGTDDLPGEFYPRGWAREHHIPKPDPDGILWLENTSDGIAIRGQSDDGIGVHAVSGSSGFALSQRTRLRMRPVFGSE